MAWNRHIKCQKEELIMNGRLKARLGSLALVMGLLVGMLGAMRTASAHSANQQDDPIALVMEMADAFNHGDADRLMELLDPSFENVASNPPAGLPPGYTDLNRDQFIAQSQSGEISIELSNCKLTAPDTVVCDNVITGPGIPPLAHPLTETITVTVVDGKLTRLVETLSEQSLSDFEDFLAAQPGMPTTGSADMRLALWVLVLASLSLVAGVITRRTHAYHR
jgi:hypothetical protein